MGGAARRLIWLKAADAASPHKTTMQRTLLFAARGIAILGIGFISLFALDAFEVEASPGDRLVGFLIHLAPSLALAGVLLMAWRRPGAGGALFIAAGLSPLLLTGNPLWTNLLLGAPFLVAGAAFAAGSRLGGGRA